MYLWIKAFHIISVISWMVGLLYLPRLFVYHSQSVNIKETNDLFKIMEKRLFFGIIIPALILSWIFGLYLLILGEFLKSGLLWVHFKLLGVVFLTLYTFILNSYRKSFLINKNIKSSQFFKIINEVPTLLMFLIVIMVVVKPV
jgi:putative membrane protein